MQTIIIAEAGVNHNGNLEIAKKLVDVAKEAGADYVKFQTFKANKIASKYAEKADYQKKQNDSEENQVEMLKKLELSEANHQELIKYCQTKNIQFLSTAFDEESIDLLKKLKIKIGKIPSGELTNFPYLKKMANSFEQIILSTGMADLNEIKETVRILIENGLKKENLTVLHCNTDYPTPMPDVNLKAMLTIQNELGVKVGYSDHTQGIEVATAAVALGASLIEKHFTLDKNMEGPDHKASLEPHELKAMIDAIRNIELALGSGEKKMTESEAKNITIARKSIVAAKNIEKGTAFTEENLTTKRPATGISPMLWETVIGQKAKRNFKEDELIEL